MPHQHLLNGAGGDDRGRNRPRRKRRAGHRRQRADGGVNTEGGDVVGALIGDIGKAAAGVDGDRLRTRPRHDRRADGGGHAHDGVIRLFMTPPLVFLERAHYYCAKYCTNAYISHFLLISLSTKFPY